MMHMGEIMELESKYFSFKIHNLDLRHNGIANKAEFERLQSEAYDSKRSSTIQDNMVTRQHSAATTITTVR